MEIIQILIGITHIKNYYRGYLNKMVGIFKSKLTFRSCANILLGGTISGAEIIKIEEITVFAEDQSPTILVKAKRRDAIERASFSLAQQLLFFGELSLRRTI